MAATPDERTFEDAVLPDAVEGFTKRRVELVQRAVKEWTGALVDLGGRNNLLRFRDLRAGTLDLTPAAPRALAALLQGKAVKTSTLFAGADERAQAMRRIRTIHNKAKENFEERGLETLSLACGIATWDNKPTAWEPAAPVLLRQASLRPLGAAQDEFELALVDEMEVNPILLHFLKVNFDCGFDQEKLLDRVDGVIDEPWELQAAYEWMIEHTKRVPAFSVAPRLVLANFAYAKLPMVRDLEGAFDELVAHELIAAIAGDEDARETIRAMGPGPDSVPSADALPLADEFLVLDADSSQNDAINAVLGGESLIVRGPPGTGKSQTIANLIGSLIARDKRVLFVAEKRAAIDAVLKRLHSQKMGDLVLDLHGGVGSRRMFAQAIGSALAASKVAPRIELGVEQSRLEKRRDELNAHAAALHEEREPWGISVYDLRTALVGLAPAATQVRFKGEILARLDRSAVPVIEEEISEYARLGGFARGSWSTPWAHADVRSLEQAQAAYGRVEQLRHQHETAIRGLEAASEQTGLPAPADVGSWEGHLRLWRDVESTLGACDKAIYEQDFDELLPRLAPANRGGVARLTASVFSGDYKIARQAVRDAIGARKVRDAELYARAVAAQEQLERWNSLGGQTPPCAPTTLDVLESSYTELLRQLRELTKLLRAQTPLEERSSGELTALIADLERDRGTLMMLPDLYRLETGFAAAGLTEFVSEMRARQVDETFALQSFRYAWLRSILDHLAISDRRVEGFIPEKHERAIQDFQQGDRRHIDSAAARIRRRCAEVATRARDEFKDQAEIVQHQANLKRRHMPVRDLVRNTADVLLALKPCWAMSPLVVSQLLPAKTYFDVVIFDEASQVTPADGATSILRARQLVVAGDEKQLPPTAFFASEAPDAEDDDELESSLVGGTKGFESILDALGALLRFRMLRWHYRSRDERLIAFSNVHIYDRQLITFPGVGVDDVLVTCRSNMIRRPTRIAQPRR